MRNRIQETLRALEGAEVRYLVVGGIAVVLHGHLRTTLDLDLVIQLDDSNIRRAMTALAELDFRPRAPVALQAFADPESRQRWIDEKHMLVFSLWHPEDDGFVLDLFVDEPFDFDEVYSRAISIALQDIEISVIGLDDLIEMKRAAGRPRDQEDLRALLRIRGLRNASNGESDG